MPSNRTAGLGSRRSRSKALAEAVHRGCDAVAIAVERVAGTQLAAANRAEPAERVVAVGVGAIGGERAVGIE